jgi:hypothetical protein
MTQTSHVRHNELTSEQLDSVSGGMTNAETPAGQAFISAFLAAGGTMGQGYDTPWPPAGRGDCRHGGGPGQHG